MPTASFASTAPTGAKNHTLTREQVLAEIGELKAMHSACGRFRDFLCGIQYDCRTATNTSIRERKLCTLRARLRDFSFTVSETIEQVERDNRQLLKTKPPKTSIDPRVFETIAEPDPEFVDNAEKILDQYGGTFKGPAK